MSVFESGVDSVRRTGGSKLAMGFADIGARPMRRPADIIGRAHVAKFQDESDGSKLARFVVPLVRLVVPVLLLVASGAAAYAYSNMPARWLPLTDIGGHPLSLGLVLMPVTFFAVHLANRRYGASYASAQIFLSWLLVAATLPLTMPYLGLLRGGVLPDIRVIAGFGAALFLAQMIAAWTFDRMRGPSWWTAPFVGSLVGGLALALIGYPAAYYDTGIEWTSPMWSYLMLTSGISVALLVPYWALRAAVPPTSGFNGY